MPAEPDARAAAVEKPHLALDEGPVPQDVLTILQKALASRSEERYASAGEFKRELERLLYGGAYSPTTFNLALFMDRLYRSEIEEEDHELERERTLDVSPYYHPTRVEVVEAPAPFLEAPKPNRTFLYVMAGGAAVLLFVIAYLLASRPASPPPVDSEAQKRMLQELVNTQVAQALKDKEEQLRKELEAEKARTDELRQQLEKQKQGAASGTRRAASDEEHSRANWPRARRRRGGKRRSSLRSDNSRRPRRLERGSSKLKPKLNAAGLPSSRRPYRRRLQSLLGWRARPLSLRRRSPRPRRLQLQQTISRSLPPSASRWPRVMSWNSHRSTRDPRPSPSGGRRAAGGVADKGVGSGYVILKALVNEKGGVDEVTVLRGLSPPRPGVEAACIEAVKQNRYKPAMKNGQKVKTWIR